MHVSTERHQPSAVTDVDWGPVSRRQQQVHVISRRFPPHQVLWTTHHLENDRKLSNATFGFTWVCSPAVWLEMCLSCCCYLVRAELGQLPSCEVWGGLRGCGEAAVHECVQGKERGQQLLLMSNREKDDSFVTYRLAHDFKVVWERERKRERETLVEPGEMLAPQRASIVPSSSSVWSSILSSFSWPSWTSRIRTDGSPKTNK